MNSDATSLSLVHLTPYIPDPSIVENLLKDKYGLTTTSLTPLNGYDDRNYRVKVKDEHDNPHLTELKSREFFVKVVNSEDSKRPSFVNSQRLVMDHLNKDGIVCQTEIQNLDGEFFSRISVDKNGENETYMVSVRTFLPGTILGDHTMTPSLLYQLGIYVAKIKISLKTFDCEFYDTFDCTWSLNNTHRIRSAVHAVKDYDMKKVVNDILDSFDIEVLPRKKDFHKGQIHGDPNEQNILVIPDDSTASGYSISGILDFQDTAKTHPVYDLAIMSAYMMMAPYSNVSPVDAAGYILAGYTSTERLLASERECLRTLIASRMVMSLVYGAHTFMQNPENAYVITTAQTGWAVMKEFWRTPHQTVEQRWDEIIDNYEPKFKHEP